jgi:hypothetical protein
VVQDAEADDAHRQRDPGIDHHPQPSYRTRNRLSPFSQAIVRSTTQRTFSNPLPCGTRLLPINKEGSLLVDLIESIIPATRDDNVRSLIGVFFQVAQEYRDTRSRWLASDPERTFLI